VRPFAKYNKKKNSVSAQSEAQTQSKLNTERSRDTRARKAQQERDKSLERAHIASASAEQARGRACAELFERARHSKREKKSLERARRASASAEQAEIKSEIFEHGCRKYSIATKRKA